MPFTPRYDFITPFADESIRLLREDWTGEHGTKMLAEELFAILQQKVPQQVSTPVTINLQGTEQDFIRMRNEFGDSVAAINFNGELVKRSNSKSTARATPDIAWDNPANIASGTPLSGTQLNAVANDPVSGYPLDGAYEYAPPSGTVLSAGTHSLSVVFTPSNSTSYKRARKTVSITVTSGGGGFGFLQAKSSQESTGSGLANRTITFDNNVAAGSLVFAVFRARDAGTAMTISDSLGNSWLPVVNDTYARYCITNGAGAMTVTFNNSDTPGGGGNLWTAAIIEYSATPTTANFDGNDDAAFPPDMAPTTTATIAVNGANNLMIGMVHGGIDTGPVTYGFTPQATFTTRTSRPSESGNGEHYMFVWDNVSISTNTVVSGTLDQNSRWACFGYSFEP